MIVDKFQARLPSLVPKTRAEVSHYLYNLFLLARRGRRKEALTAQFLFRRSEALFKTGAGEQAVAVLLQRFGLRG